MVIYCIQNLITGKKYIGKFRNCNSNEEFQKSRYFGSGKYLWNSIKKYGKENFKKWVLINCKKESGGFYEILWIKKLKTKFPNGYNLTDGGDGVVGRKHTEEEKKKISEFSKNRKHTEEEKRKIGIAQKGKFVTKQTRDKQSISAKNKPKITEETLRKRSISLKQVIHNEEWCRKISEGKLKSGYFHSEETRKKMSKKLLGRKQSTQEIEKRKISLKKVIHNEEWCRKISEGRKRGNLINTVPFELYTSLIEKINGVEKCL